MYNVSENAVPTQYPLALGAYDAVWCDANKNGPWSQAVLESHGCFEKPVPASAAAMVAAKVSNKNFLKEELAKAYPSGDWTSRLSANAELFKGVPNYLIYGGAALLVLARYFKKGK